MNGSSNSIFRFLFNEWLSIEDLNGEGHVILGDRIEAFLYQRIETAIFRSNDLKSHILIRRCTQNIGNAS